MRKWIMTLFVFIVIGFCTSAVYAVTTDPAITLISPPENEAIVADNLLISVKVTQPGRILKISAGALQVKSGDKFVPVKADGLEDYNSKKDDEKQVVSILETKTFESKGSVSFFTHKIENITPGIYVIIVNTVDYTGETIYSKEAYILIREQTEDEAKVTFNSQRFGTSQFLQNLLSKIFRN